MTMADHTETLKRNGIDYDEALERFGGNAALYERLAAKFLGDSHFTALEQSLSAGDIKTARYEAHTLKGVAGNLSFDDLYAAASTLDEALRANDPATAAESMDAVRTAYRRVSDILHAIGT